MVRSRLSSRKSLKTIADDYFHYVGTQLPQLCANDEFYFFPRSEIAIHHLNKIDDLSQEKIQGHIRYVKDLLTQISPEEQEDIEGETDRVLLRQSMEGFIRELDDAQTWRYDPTLYVKIPLFATDQVVSQDDPPTERLKSDLLTILDQIPSFLKHATDNLLSPSEISARVAHDMAKDALDFYHRDLRSFIVEKLGEDQELFSQINEVLEAFEYYMRTLADGHSGKPFAIGEEGLKKILTLSLGYHRSPDEILQIAQDTYRETEEKLRQLAIKISRGKRWKTIISEQAPSEISTKEIMQAYQEEVRLLRRFFYEKDIIGISPDEKVLILKTPSYLNSLRATASYQAPLTGSANRHGLFFITPGKVDLELISVHRPYLCGHETYPGHHVLDNLRITHENPIRRQIESPLYYEGWSCYAEQLLDDLGYIKDPRLKLVGLKRQLWRNLRAALDVELHTGRITLAEGANKIEKVGFSLKRALRQMRRFALTPGYQLCYFMGNYEILRLRKRFDRELGLKAFHDALLGGGQLPFHLVEKRLEARIVECE